MTHLSKCHLSIALSFWITFMNNIKVIKTGINVSKILAQLKLYKDDWNSEGQMKGASTVQKEFDFPQINAGVLQLVIGGVENETQYVGDTEYCIKTPAYNRHTEIVDRKSVV